MNKNKYNERLNDDLAECDYDPFADTVGNINTESDDSECYNCGEELYRAEPKNGICSNCHYPYDGPCEEENEVKK